MNEKNARKRMHSIQEVNSLSSIPENDASPSSMSPATTRTSPKSSKSPKSQLTKRRRILSNSPKHKTQKIMAVMNSLEPKIKARDLTKMLKLVCPNPSQCLVLSAEYIPHFHKLFNHFSDFSLLSPNHPRQFMRISSGANGFVNELYYQDKTNTYHTSAIIKSGYSNNNHRHIENLVYEGLAGMFFINEQLYKFPCFIETYGICKYVDTNESNSIKSQLSSNNKDNYKEIQIDEVNEGIYPIFTPTQTHQLVKSKRTIYNSKVLNNVLTDSDKISIIIQNIPNAIDINAHFSKLLVDKSNPIYTSFGLNEELFTLFFQLYSVLSYLSDKFTHNDLHGGNALIYPLKNNYIKMVYHMKDEVEPVQFYTNKIIKTIDYGRSYVSGDYFDSNCFYKSVCKMEKVMEKYPNVNFSSKKTPIIDIGCDISLSTITYGPYICAEKYGFYGIWKHPKNASTVPYISSVHRNKTADLLLIRRLHGTLLTYIYKYDFKNALSEFPDIMVLLKRSTYILLNGVFNVYATRDYEKIVTDYGNMMEEVEKALAKHKHIIVEQYNTHNTDPIKLWFVYNQPDILSFLLDKEPQVYTNFTEFIKSPLNHVHILNAYNNYQKILQYYKDETIVKSKTDKINMVKHITLSEIKMNILLNEMNPYRIVESDGVNELSNVDSVCDYLKTAIQKAHMLQLTKEYFEHNRYNNKPYTYIGELHVYLDGSDKNSHFIGAEYSANE